MLAAAVEEGGNVKHDETCASATVCRGGDGTIVRPDPAWAQGNRRHPMTARTQYLALVRWSARDWWRTRSAALLVLVLALVYGLANFLAGLAVTEVTAQQVTFYAGLARPLLALLFALAIVVGLVRELDDRVLDMLLARPLARRTWYLAKLTGQLLAAGVLALVTALPLLPLVPPGDLAVWALSFACELAILAALALACATSLGQVAPAMTAVGGFYVLARVVTALQLMSTGPTVDPASPIDRVIAWGVAALAHVLPDFARYTQSRWLVEGASGAEPGYVLGQCVLYTGLLTLLGLIDFERRNL